MTPNPIQTRRHPMCPSREVCPAGMREEFLSGLQLASALLVLCLEGFRQGLEAFVHWGCKLPALQGLELLTSIGAATSLQKTGRPRPSPSGASQSHHTVIRIEAQTPRAFEALRAPSSVNRWSPILKHSTPPTKPLNPKPLNPKPLNPEPRTLNPPHGPTYLGTL